MNFLARCRAASLGVSLLVISSVGCGDGSVGRGAPDAGPPEPEGPVVGVDVSGGVGGLPCVDEGTSGDFDYCVAEVAFTDTDGTPRTVEIKIVSPLRPASVGSLQLAFHFHGDNAGGYLEDWGWRRFAGWAMDNDALLVSVLAPNRCSWWRRPEDAECTGTGDSEGGNANAVAAVIRAVRGAFDLWLEPTLHVGFSGGALFSSSILLPNAGDVYPGAYVVNCGGDRAWGGIRWDETDPGLRDRLSLYFTWGTDDFLAEQIGRGVAFYEDLGFRVDTLEIPDRDHCDGRIDWTSRTTAIWSRHPPILRSQLPPDPGPLDAGPPGG